MLFIITYSLRESFRRNRTRKGVIIVADVILLHRNLIYQISLERFVDSGDIQK